MVVLVVALVAGCGDGAAQPDAAVTVDAAAADAPGGDAAPGDARVLDAATVDAAPLMVPCTQLLQSFGTAVPLQQATATLAQTHTNGPYLPAHTIDGLDNTGWAISPATTAVMCPGQTLAVETVTSTPSFPGGTRLLVALQHRFAAEHGLGRFRVSVTTADRSQFADGVDGTTTPGNVGAAGLWTVLTPRRMCSTNDATMTQLPDGSIRVQDLDTATMDYYLELDTSLAGITGLRLETLNDPALPQNGPGLQNVNGNFVLSELQVRVGSQ